MRKSIIDESVIDTDIDDDDDKPSITNFTKFYNIKNDEAVKNYYRLKFTVFFAHLIYIKVIRALS